MEKIQFMIIWKIISWKKLILSKGKTHVTERLSIKERICSEYTFQVRVRDNTQNGKFINDREEKNARGKICYANSFKNN